MSRPSAELPPADGTAVASLQELQRRLARAEADRDTWHISGDPERYLAAYGLVEVLEFQLEQRLRQRHA